MAISTSKPVLIAVLGVLINVCRIAKKTLASRTAEDGTIVFLFQKTIVAAFLGGVLFFMIGFGILPSLLCL